MSASSLLIIDGHVHIHDCFDLPRFFGFAFSNCLRVARKLGDNISCVPVLMLAEGPRQGVFHHIQDETKQGNDRIADEPTGGYQVLATEEDESLRIQGKGGMFLFLVAGRQIVTEERLEVLALATLATIPEGLPLEETVASVEKEGALPVVPWGFGKWSGRRRRVLTKYLASRREGVFFLGDNSGRPNFLRFPDFRKKAPGVTVKVLPGSDALPFPSEQRKVCSFGFTLREGLDLRRPVESLKRILMKPGEAPTPFGSPESALRFARNQMVLRIWKHRI